MSKDRDGYMKTSQDVDMRLIKPNIKVDADKNITYVIESMDEFIKSKKDEDIVIHCKGIQLYPKKLNSLSHSFERSLTIASLSDVSKVVSSFCASASTSELL